MPSSLPPVPVPPPCVVAINDDATFLTMLCEMLTLQGFACHPLLYADLERGLAELPALAPAAIILDVRLGQPEESWTIRARLKADGTLREAALIMCSADWRALDRCAAELAAAGDVALPKPFTMDALLAMLTQILARRNGPTSSDAP